MNYQKDTQGQSLISQRNSTGIEAFSITLSKKCERLATAIYLVTNFLSDTEPMKSRLRTLSLDFVRDASFVRYGAQATEASVLDTLRANIGETLSLLELAFIAGLVSEMNFTILKREYASLRDSIDIKKASRESRTDTILGDNFFGTSFHEEGGGTAPASKGPTFESADSRLGRRPAVGRTFMSPASVPAPAPASSLRGTKQSSSPAPAPIPNSKFDIPNSAQKMSDRTPKGQQASRPEQRSDLARTREGGTFVPPSVTPASAPIQNSTFDIPHSVSKESRRARILKLVKDNREVAIRDIVAHFPDISEKTIQRELVSLSDSGVLKKSGERRWSRYTLA